MNMLRNATCHVYPLSMKKWNEIWKNPSKWYVFILLDSFIVEPHKKKR